MFQKVPLGNFLQNSLKGRGETKNEEGQLGGHQNYHGVRGWHGNGEEGFDTRDIPKWGKKRPVIITKEGLRRRKNQR